MKLLFTLIFALLVVSLSSGQNNSNRPMNHPSVRKVLVKEVLQTTNYTYLQVIEKDSLQWLAIPKMENAEVGETYFFQGGNEMRDFKSNELNRTFESVLFLGGVVNLESFNEQKSETKATTTEPETKAKKTTIVIDPIEGGITLAELFSKKKRYSNKIVKIKGKVTQFNSSIMNRNWIHLQDGTEYDGNFDLVVTTDMYTEKGDIVVIEGKITLDKDFGYGYFYKVLMEEGKIIQ